MTTIIIFGASLLIAALMLTFKWLEFKRGQQNLVLRFVSRLDSHSVNLVMTVKFRGLQIIQTLKYLILVRGRLLLKEWLIKTEAKIMEEYHKKQEVILMGKKDILNKGAVSFYLKKITENKGNEKGKIEDSL